jgi:hypothetical protein
LNSTGSPPVTKTIGMNELRGALGNPVRFILTQAKSTTSAKLRA